MRVLKNILYLYIAIGLCFGVARFGWGAAVAAMSEPNDGAFMSALIAAGIDGLIRVVDWAPTLVMEVLMGGGDPFDWLLY